MLHPQLLAQAFTMADGAGSGDAGLGGADALGHGATGDLDGDPMNTGDAPKGTWLRRYPLLGSRRCLKWKERG